MSKRTWMIIGALVTLDGLLLAVLGSRYVRMTRLGPPGNPIFEFADWLLQFPDPALRAMGAVEAGLGLVAMGQENRAQIVDAVEQLAGGAREVIQDRLGRA